jgi:methionyl-tRNA formyltransferase
LPILRSIIDHAGSNLCDVTQRQLEIHSNTILSPNLESFTATFDANKDKVAEFIIDTPGIITQPDRELRGKVQKNPVSQFAHQHSIPLFQPYSLKNQSKEYSQFCNALPNDTIGLIASYGKILSTQSITTPTYNSINWHPSLLPQYRGPTPMQTSILNGEVSSGLTWIDMDEGMDTGDILVQLAQEYKPTDTVSEVVDIFGMLGSETWAIAITMQLFTNHFNFIRSKPQNHDEATYTKMLSKDQRSIDLKITSSAKLIKKFKAHKLFPGTSFYSDYFESEVRIDELSFEGVESIDHSRYQDNQFVYTDSRETFIQTLDGYVRIEVITVLDTGKKIQFSGFEFTID